MKPKIPALLITMAINTFLITSCKKHDVPHQCDGDDKTVTTSKVFATGLNNPRGLKFGPDGNLYVAEGGLGGTNSTVGQCQQVFPGPGPYLGSPTGSGVSKINQNGVRTVITYSLPSSQLSKEAGSLVSGIADVAFIGNDLYALLTAAGCSHGVPSVPNGVVKINPNGSWSMIANLSEYTMTHQTAHPERGVGEPDGTPYSMINVNNNLYIIEPNHGDFIKVGFGGVVSRFVDISATLNHVVPTVQAFHHGNFYIANLDTFPAPHGGSAVYKITPSGQISTFAEGFNMVLGIAFDQSGRLYVLENTTNNPFPTPKTGDIVRVDPSGQRQIIVTGLNFPTGMTFGPDGKLYVSNVGYGPEAIGGGEILQISFKCEEVMAAPN